ncbi:cyclic nucleotide-gated channel cone photoreceptor subunit alpha-like [Sinocyclocheilus grahami]|uniref:cyclic nucleotide-gated channel cone photoreceptor subunit alpha-like n=1 Tax=Sinocyclocheilus grahami TaxID=75366 RepID=UPI0007AC86F3|nr:PREDICTED: cyclic nucleotide-gated channel cone photoreceptor subunit alpha-like [Sinocyclocheilus grahami]
MNWIGLKMVQAGQNNKRILKGSVIWAHSLCEDTSSDMQGIISSAASQFQESRRSSFTGAGAMARKANHWPLAAYNMNNCNNTDDKKEDKKK